MTPQCDCKKGTGCSAIFGKTLPDNFRLAKRPNGELILQGYFSWQCMGCGVQGGEWHDLQTVILPVILPISEKITRWKKLEQLIVKLISLFAIK